MRLSSLVDWVLQFSRLYSLFKRSGGRCISSLAIQIGTKKKKLSKCWNFLLFCWNNLLNIWNRSSAPWVYSTASSIFINSFFQINVVADVILVVTCKLAHSKQIISGMVFDVCMPWVPIKQSLFLKAWISNLQSTYRVLNISSKFSSLFRSFNAFFKSHL